MIGSTTLRAENTGALSNKKVGDIKKEIEAQYEAEIGLSKQDNSLTNAEKNFTPRAQKLIRAHKTWI